MSQVAYDPNNAQQNAFLAALEKGESGGSAGAYSVGVGGSDLTGSTTDQYGFPIWNGVGNSHAAGAYQFQPSTWDNIASEFGLNFNDPEDQNAGAWYLAQQTDPNLSTDLATGNYSAIQSALAKVWPSVTGNAASPQGLANTLGGATAANAAPTGGNAAGTGSAAVNPILHPIQAAEDAAQNLFTRGAMIVIGGIVLLVALWLLLSSQGIVPSPEDAAKGVGAALAV